MTHLQYDAAINDFKEKLKEYTLEAKCGRSYVLVEQLTKWLKSKRPETNTTQASNLLSATYSRRQPQHQFLPITPRQLETDEECRLIIFSILLKLELGHLIHYFQRWGRFDTHLPIDLQLLKPKFKGLMSRCDADKLLTSFEEAQWSFCPARFKLDMGREFDRNEVIPICGKEMINAKGGTAQLWQIKIQEEFVGPDLRDVAQSAKFVDKKFGNCYQFALKTFEEGNKSLYENESKAFSGLRGHSGMVRYFGEYEHKEADTCKTTHNILLEYGEFDLDEFFAERLPPVLQTEVEEFWVKLFEVANALDGIHNLRTCTDGITQEYRGWHADIKPDNILSVQGKFKL